MLAVIARQIARKLIAGHQEIPLKQNRSHWRIGEFPGLKNQSYPF